MPRRSQAARRTQGAPAIFTVDTARAGRIPVTVTRKQVKNLNLRVRNDGTVFASVPLRTSDTRVQRFLDAHAGWIAARVLRARAHAERMASDVKPKTVPLWGTLVPLDKVLAKSPAFRAHGAHEGAASQTPSKEQIDAAIVELYRAEVARALPAVAAEVEQRIGVHASGWQIRVMKTRWGSCTPRTKRIRINARLAAYPPACLSYVVAHELCHLIEASHNERFYMLLDTYSPGYCDAISLLKRPARDVANRSDQPGA